MLKVSDRRVAAAPYGNDRRAAGRAAIRHTTPMVSVVIPVRDREQALPGAIRSVLAQTFDDLELLVVDDHSGDGTRQVVETFATQDSRVRLLKVTQGRGAQAARNRGIRAATGEYVALLDSDDAWAPRLLAMCLHRLQQTGRQVAYTEGRIVHQATGQVEPRTGVARLDQEAYSTLLRRPPGPVFSGLVVARDAWVAMGDSDDPIEPATGHTDPRTGPDPVCGNARTLGHRGPLDEDLVAFQEWDTCLRLARACGDFALVDEALFTWHRHGNQTISGDGQRNADGYAQVVAKHKAAILKHVGAPALAAHYQQLATLHERLGRSDEAWHCRCQARWLSGGGAAPGGPGEGDRAGTGRDRGAVADGAPRARAEEGIRVYG